MLPGKVSYTTDPQPTPSLERVPGEACMPSSACQYTMTDPSDSYILGKKGERPGEKKTTRASEEAVVISPTPGLGHKLFPSHLKPRRIRPKVHLV